MVSVSCAYCGNPFEVHPYRALTARYCKRECQLAARAEAGRVSLVCATCGKAFTRGRGAGRSDEGAYCSRPCYWAAGQVATTCPVCDQAILVERWRYEANKTGVYCCWACKCAGHKGRPGSPIPVTCEACGRNYKRPRGTYWPGHQFCNARCKGDWMRTHRRGENHPSWQGGGIYYYGPNWSAQRDAARARDRFTCQNPSCGLTEAEHGRQLHVHHRKPFRSFGCIPRENEAYRAANALNNLVTLCPSCHIQAEFGVIRV